MILHILFDDRLENGHIAVSTETIEEFYANEAYITDDGEITEEGIKYLNSLA